jgi:dienelactone hydrolase
MPVAAPGLPEPTGPYPAGTTSVWLRDTSRPDPWVAEVSVRELMVSLWYPAASSDGRRARYMTPAESRLQLTSRSITTGVPPDALSTVRTNASVDATAAGSQHSLPLVVLSPGFTNSRSTLTGLAEDLASHGYVVAGIDHTYESFATAFPDGRVTTARAREAPQGRGFWEKVTAGRAADVGFVLGELTGAHPAWPGAALIDPSRMAMAGHSAGGAAAISAMLADSRIRAGIDMDGATHAPIPDGGLSRPFLFLGKQSNYTPGSGIIASPDGKHVKGSVITWERDWELLTGWKRWLVVAGAVHASFTDLALLADQIGIDTGAGTPGARSLDITRAYVRAFFDLHLRGEPQALLDQPSPRYPEVTFCSPARG